MNKGNNSVVLMVKRIVLQQ